MDRFGPYSQDLKASHTALDGTLNLVQLIINKIEAGDTQNALLIAVELLQELALPNEELKEQLPASLKDTARLIQHREAVQASRESRAHEAGYNSGKRITLIHLGLDPDDGDTLGLGIDRPAAATDTPKPTES